MCGCVPADFTYFLNISSIIGEGNGTPLQYSCLENPMDGGAWQAAVHGVAKDRTRLSDLTFTFHFSLSCIGEGNGNPPQCSCLENPRDWGAWWAAVYGVAQSRTQLKQLSSSSGSTLTFPPPFHCRTASSDWKSSPFLTSLISIALSVVLPYLFLVLRCCLGCLQRI